MIQFLRVRTVTQYNVLVDLLYSMKVIKIIIVRYTRVYEGMIFCKGTEGQLYSPPNPSSPTDTSNDYQLTKAPGTGETEGLTFLYGGTLYNMTSTGNDIIKA